MINRWNAKNDCITIEDSFEQLICFSLMYINAQKAGLQIGDSTVPFRGSSTLKDGCEVTDKFGAPLPVDVSGGFFIDDGHVKVTQVTAAVVSALATAVAADIDAFEQAGIVQQSLDIIKHGLDYLSASRVTGSDMVVQVGDSRIDEQCSEATAENTAEKRKVLSSSRQYPATDVLGATSGAFFAAAAAYRAAGDESESVRLNKKARAVLKALLNTPKGLSVENPTFSPGQLAVGWRSACFEDEVAWATTWGCTLEMDEMKADCFNAAEQLLNEAEQNCQTEKAEIKWNWNDVRAGTRFLLAKYHTNKQNVKACSLLRHP